MMACDHTAGDWTVVLRQRPLRLVGAWPEGGYTTEFEIICCACGDTPYRDYRDVSPRQQRIRGPYSLAAGIAAYEQHLERHQDRQASGRAHLQIVANDVASDPTEVNVK